jgi:polysaccharide pyruvyl transferase WcaK-like protein
VHTDSEVPIARRLRRSVPRLRVVRAGAPALRWFYGELDLMLSMMLHSSILAFAAGTPVVNLAYDDKNRAFMADTGHPERCLDGLTATLSEVLLASRSALAAGRLPPDRLSAWHDATRHFVARLIALPGLTTTSRAGAALP